jgi:RNA polymerase sigma factor (sigma-70 family)
MGIVRLALQRPYTFAVMAILIVMLGVVAIRQFELTALPSSIFRSVPAPLVSRPVAAYHSGPGGKGVPRSTDRRPRMTRSGTIMPVDESPLTRASLLLQIRDGSNQPAWQEFVSLYGPVVYGFARKRGLQDADAADLMQDVLRSVSSAIGRLDYDRAQGTFRGWLFTITRNKIFNFLTARRIRPQGSGDSSTNRLLASQPEASDGADTWELEYQRRLAALAMDRVKPEFQEKTWRAFWLTAVEGASAADVANRIGLSPGAIYVAKSRVLARLKDEVEVLRQQEEA